MSLALICIAAACLIPQPGLVRARCPELADLAETDGIAQGSGRGSRKGLSTQRASTLAVAACLRCAEKIGVGGWVRGRLDAARSKASPQELMDAAAALDVLSAALRAGLPMAEAVRVVSVGCAPGLRAVFHDCASRLALGVARPWDSFMTHPALMDVAVAAERSAQSGTALTRSFEEMAVAHRERAADAGEAVAERAGVLIAGPLALCFLPAFVLLGLVPTVAGLADSMFEGLIP